MANILGLTTTFTPMPSCLKDLYKYNASTTYVQSSSILTYYFLSLGPPATSDCLPTGWDSTSQYFSPGVCPEGYLAACTNTNIAGTVTETSATCCPSGYGCQAFTTGGWPWFSTEQCTKAIDGTVPTTMELTTEQSIDGTLTKTTFTTVMSTGGINAYGISIRYQATDLAAETATTSSSSSSALTSPTTSTSTSSITHTPNTGGAVSKGTAAGIGIGVALGVITLAVIFGLLFLRYRKQMKDQRALEGPIRYPNEQYKDLAPDPPYELHTVEPEHELYGSRGG